MGKRFIAVLLTILVSLIALALANDWLLVPNLRAGDVRRGTSESELRKVFGTRNIQRGKIYLGEGENEDGLVIFSADPVRKLEIRLTPGRLVESVRIQGGRSAWRFENGITLGTTLKQLEVLNGGPFELSGWGWDYSGAVLGWKGGHLAKSLSWDENQQRVWMRLNPPDSRWKVLTATENETLVGDKNHESSEPALQKLNPALIFIEVQLAQR